MGEVGWQDFAVFGIVLLALGFLVRKMWPRSRRPDVETSRLVRKKPRR